MASEAFRICGRRFGALGRADQENRRLKLNNKRRSKMKVIHLEIKKRESYDSEYPNEIVGVVRIVGDTGKMEVRLFPKTVAEIFRLCKEDVQRVANYNASQASQACDDVADTMDLQISNNDLKQIS